MAKLEIPVFYCYYCTVGGDVLGKLLFTQEEMIFEPLNDHLKGYFSYSTGLLLDNLSMGFVLNYSDILDYP